MMSLFKMLIHDDKVQYSCKEGLIVLFCIVSYTLNILNFSAYTGICELAHIYKHIHKLVIII